MTNKTWKSNSTKSPGNTTGARALIPDRPVMKFLKIIIPVLAFMICCGAREASAANLATPTAPYPVNTTGSGYYLKWRADGAITTDYYGYAVSGAGDVNADGTPDIIVGAYNADPGGRTNAGSVYVYSGATGVLLYQYDGGTASDALGFSVSTAGDVNGDGYADFMFGAHGYDPTPLLSAAGRAYVYSGFDGSLLYQKDGAAVNSYVGIAVSVVGDVNGDGKSDFIVGAQGAGTGGAAYVYSGADGSVIYTKLGAVAADQFGGFVSNAGDVNGDGVQDFIVAAIAADPAAKSAAGSAYVYSGATGALLYQKDGGTASDFLGSWVSAAGDVNGDGRSDFIIGSWGYDVPASAAGTALVYSGIDGSLLYQKNGPAANAQNGRRLSTAGDLDGDGKSEFIGQSILNAGSMYIYSGATGGLLYQKDGAGNLDRFGWAFAPIGDINGDGKNDFVVGSYLGDPGGIVDAGSAYVFASDFIVPTVTNNQTGDNSWRASDPGAIYDIDFADTGGANIDYVQYSVWTGAGMTGTQTISWTNIASGVNAASYTSNWGVTYSSLAQGQSYVSVRAFDYASNTSAVATDAFYIRKDTAAPDVTNNQAGDNTWRNSNTGTYDVDFSDAYSGLDKFQINACTTNANCSDIIAVTDTVTGLSATATYTANWALPAAVWSALPEGQSYISVTSYDAIGNYATSGPYFYVRKDTAGPAGGSISYLDGSASGSISITFATGTDTMSGFASATIQRQFASFASGTCGSYSGWADLVQNPASSPYTDPTVSDGNCYQYKLISEDNLGNTASYTAAATSSIDTTAPAPGTLTLASGGSASFTGLSFALASSFTDAGSQIATCEYCMSVDGVCDTEWATASWYAAAGTCSKTSISCTDGQSLTLQMAADDNAGNSTQTATLSRTCEGTSPAVTFNAPPGSSTQTTAFQIDISDSDAQSGLATCEYMVESDLSGWTTTRSWTSRTCNSSTSVSVTIGPALDCQGLGQNSCRVSVRATDVGGNVSATVSRTFNSEDLTGPSTAATVNDGESADSGYASSATQLTANWTAATDVESGIAKYWYSIGTTAGASDVASWTDNGTSTLATKTGLALTEGNPYYFSVSAVNGAGMISTVTSSNGQIVDSSAPSVIATVNDGTGADVAYSGSTTQLSANWTSSSDAISGVAKYWYSIGTSAGASDVVSWTDNATATSVTKTGLSLVVGSTYYFSIKPENGSGIQAAAVNSNGQTIENSPPGAIATVNDGAGSDVFYAASASQLSANWSDSTDAETGVAKYWYSIGTSAGASDTVSWTDNAAATSVTKTGLSLTDGVTYYFSIKAENGSGLLSVISSSDGQAVETTAPSSSAPVNDGAAADIDYTTSTTQLSANWTASADAQSGVAKYWYSIGTSAGASDTVSWTDNATSTTVTKTGLSLSVGTTYYFSVKSENGFGLLTAAATSDGQTVDTTAPSAPATVNDGLAADSAFASSATQLAANWTAGADAESGVAKYWYAIGTTAGATDVVDWTDNGASTSASKTGLSLTDGQTYYFSVKSENGVAMTSAAVTNSNGQTVDSSAPSTIATVNDGTGADETIALSSDRLSANWSASADAQSGVAKYWYAIGTTQGGTELLGWTDNAAATSVTKTGLALVDGQTYYISVKAENGGGGLSAAANSNGAMADAASPTVLITTPSAGANITGSYNISGTISDATLTSWSLSYGAGASPTAWGEIASGTTQVSNTLLGVWNASSLSGAYVLKLTATDASGRTSQTTTAVSANGTATLTGTISKFKWTLMSVPLQPAAADPISMFGSSGLYKVYRWDPTATSQQYYSQYTYPQSLTAGQGFWIASFYNDLPYSYSGTLADSTQNFTLPLKTGWNQIGTPFNRNYAWASVQVKYNGSTYDLNTAAAMGLISATFNGYDSSAGSWAQKDASASLEPQTGYFARAYKDIDLLFDPAAGQSGGLARLVRNSYEFKIKLSASSKQSSDKDNYIAAAASARADYDQLDAEEPPVTPAEKYTVLYFPHEDWSENAGRYTNDSRPAAKTAGQAEGWNFNIDTNEAGETVTLSWDNSKLPTDKYTFTLVNTETGQRTDMAVQSSIAYTAANSGASTARFRIEAIKTVSDTLPSITKTHTLTGGWRLVSAPVEPDATSASAVFGGKLPLLNLYQYADGKFHAAADADIQAGLGYWVNTPGNIDITIQGKPADSQVTVPLKTGWNIIGNPYETNLAWGDNITLACDGATLSLNQAAAASRIDSTLYEYDGSAYIQSTVLEPWHGYLLKAKSDCDLILKQ